MAGLGAFAATSRLLARLMAPPSFFPSLSTNRCTEVKDYHETPLTIAPLGEAGIIAHAADRPAFLYLVPPCSRSRSALAPAAVSVSRSGNDGETSRSNAADLVLYPPLLSLPKIDGIGPMKKSPLLKNGIMAPTTA